MLELGQGHLWKVNPPKRTWKKNINNKTFILKTTYFVKSPYTSIHNDILFCKQRHI